MALETLIKKAIEEGASDLHLRGGSPPRLRIDGELYEIKQPVPTDQEIKQAVYEMLTKEQIERFEHYKELDFAFSAPHICRMRINLFLQRNNFCASIRIIPDHIPTMEEVYLPKACYNFVDLNKGLVLVTGPSGCGKSTTLAAMINHINANRRCHILTIEDPIEFVYCDKHAMVSQREVALDTRSFSTALRHTFRQDPDVILLGEMRDLETMQTAITLAETGHLTFSTLHTGEAAQTINRIIDSFPPHQQEQIRAQLMVSLEGIISQKLVPLKDRRGRVAAREVLICNRAVKNLIREGKIQQISSAIQTGLEEGMVTMNNSLGQLYKKGLISYRVALNTSWDKKEFAAKYHSRQVEEYEAL